MSYTDTVSSVVSATFTSQTSRVPTAAAQGQMRSAATAQRHRRSVLPYFSRSSVLRTGAEVIIVVEYAARAGTARDPDADRRVLIAGTLSGQRPAAGASHLLRMTETARGLAPLTANVGAATPMTDFFPAG